MHMQALLSGYFYATYASLRHYVVFLVPLAPVQLTCGLINSARWSGAICVSWELASVMCLGVFVWWLMSETHYN